MEICHDCPHRRENEVGDSILIIEDGNGKMATVAHVCHNSRNFSRYGYDRINVKCEGHRRTLEKLQLGVIKVEDFQEVRKVIILS